jgi:hypothetical protein
MHAKTAGVNPQSLFTDDLQSRVSPKAALQLTVLTAKFVGEAKRLLPDELLQLAQELYPDYVVLKLHDKPSGFKPAAPAKPQAVLATRGFPSFPRAFAGFASNPRPRRPI